MHMIGKGIISMMCKTQKSIYKLVGKRQLNGKMSSAMIKHFIKDKI